MSSCRKASALILQHDTEKHEHKAHNYTATGIRTSDFSVRGSNIIV